MTDPVRSLSDGVQTRLKTLLLALDRQDRLETAQEFVGWLSGQDSPDPLALHARELLLRALRVAGDPINFQILARLDKTDPIGLADLIEATGLSRVALSERIHDLVQVGLAVREMINDQVRGTDLSAGLRTLVDDVARRAGTKLAETLSKSTKRGNRPGVLP